MLQPHLTLASLLLLVCSLLPGMPFPLLTRPCAPHLSTPSSNATASANLPGDLRQKLSHTATRSQSPARAHHLPHTDHTVHPLSAPTVCLSCVRWWMPPEHSLYPHPCKNDNNIDKNSCPNRSLGMSPRPPLCNLLLNPDKNAVKEVLSISTCSRKQAQRASWPKRQSQL